MSKFSEILSDDRRALSIRGDLRFPEDCAQAPESPGICLVECPAGSVATLVSPNLRETLSPVTGQQDLAWTFLVTRTLRLPVTGSLLFVGTATVKDAEELSARLTGSLHS